MVSRSTINYIDDIYAVCHRNHADRAYNTLKEILTSIGLPLNHKKAFAPCTKLKIMAINMDIETRTFSIAPDKLLDIMCECVIMFL